MSDLCYYLYVHINALCVKHFSSTVLVVLALGQTTHGLFPGT